MTRTGSIGCELYKTLFTPSSSGEVLSPCFFLPLSSIVATLFSSLEDMDAGGYHRHIVDSMSVEERQLPERSRDVKSSVPQHFSDNHERSEKNS
ncbi:jg14189 [Pararge aegeria aegeria]|uniref:Jg14189 protein n=1 Tax=Pararge aegeria aegeria TaxID=348720 RepID=A0A8S4SA25_9NEOP|nr:jg14189 [Pararge aegeria aegeria]